MPRIPLAAILLVTLSCTQSGNKNQYLSQTPASSKPELFAPGLISLEDEFEFGSVFSKDGTEFFYGVDINGRSEIRYTELHKGSWTEPEIIMSHDKYGFNDPFLSPDEDELYYISDMPFDGKGESKDHDIWYSKRIEKAWSDPINAGTNINSGRNEYYISFTDQKSMLFASNVDAEEGKARDFDIYQSEWSGAAFQKASRLDDAINSSFYEADVFIAPDESYLIFCSIRPDGFGQGDLYVSFKKGDASWTEAKNMGNVINTEFHELCPFVTRDGKFLFYSSNRDIYWVDAHIIENYRE